MLHKPDLFYVLVLTITFTCKYMYRNSETHLTENKLQMFIIALKRGKISGYFS